MPSENSSTHKSARLWLAAIAVAAVWFAGLEYRALMNPDEGRYAEIPRELVVKGDWITPRLNDLKYFEKPPLQYWATALAYEALGEHNWTARLYPALTGLLGVLVAFFAGRRLFGDTVGLVGAAILSSSFLYLLGAQVVTLDMGLTFFLQLALLGFLLAQRDGASSRSRRQWMWLAWLALGLAVLSKGMIGIVLPGLAVLAYSLWQRDWDLWRRLHLGSGMLLFLLVAAPWFIAVSLQNANFPEFFFMREHIQRFVLQEHQRLGPWWYFLPVLLLGMFPWVGLLGNLLPGERPGASAGNASVDAPRFLLAWCIVVVAFFSLSRSKLPFYVLPVLPPLALLIALSVTTLSCRQLAMRFALIVVLAILILTHLPALVGLTAQKFPRELVAMYQPWLAVSVLWLLVFASAATLLAWRNRRVAAVLAMAIAGLGFGKIALTGSNELAPALSSRQIVGRLDREPDAFDRRVPFFSIEEYDQTLPFYLKRPVTLVNYAGELAMGIGLEPAKAIADESEYFTHWQALDLAYAILPIRELAEFSRQGMPYREVARDWRRVVISRR